MSEKVLDQYVIREVADALYQAQANVQAIAPVRELLGDGNLAAAYQVQEVLMSRREADGFARVGRKVGLTNLVVQQQLGVTQPDYGVLLANMDVSELNEVNIDQLVAPRIEAELAFVMAKDVVALDRAAIIDAIDYVVVAFEIVDSRVHDWNISIVDTVADNASSALYVLGNTRVPLEQVDTVGVRMSMTENGTEVSRGTGAACLGDPINALVWVAETAAATGRPLLAGEVVLSGALGPMVPFVPGSTYEASVTGLGVVKAVAGKGAV